MLVLQFLPENYQNASETSRRQAAFLEGPPLYKRTAKRIQEKFIENSAKIFLLKMPQILGQKGQSFDPHNHMPPEFAQRGAELNNFNGKSQSPLCKHSPKAKRSRLVKVVVLWSFRKTSVWISPAKRFTWFDHWRLEGQGFHLWSEATYALFTFVLGHRKFDPATCCCGVTKSACGIMWQTCGQTEKTSHLQDLRI